MTNNNTLTIGDAGAMLIGAGLTKLDNLYLALGLIGAGVLLKVLVAVLNKNDIQVSTPLG